MKYLVDANVLSEPTKPIPSSRVIAWLRVHKKSIVLDPIVLGEIHFGILQLPIGKKRRELEKWFEFGVSKLPCLTWNSVVAMRWSQLLAELRTAGTSMSVKDSLIAASALARGLTVATRNEKDFKKSGVAVINPFDETAS